MRETTGMGDDRRCDGRAYNDASSASPSPSPSSSPPAQSRRMRGKKLDVYKEVLRLLRCSCNEEAMRPGFEDELYDHFNRLPTRYALDVNIERAEDVLMHKKLLYLALDPDNRPAVEVRLVQAPTSKVQSVGSVHSGSLTEDTSQGTANFLNRKSIHPPPAFNSLSNLQVLALEAVEALAMDGSMHEITFSTEDKPKLLSQLTCLLSDVGLNIQEAHVFSTADGYSLDVFVVDGWPYEGTERLATVIEKEVCKRKETERLATVIEKEVCKRKKAACLGPLVSSPSRDEQTGLDGEVNHVPIPTDESDVWEIDVNHLKFGDKVASGSYGDLYRGIYRSQDVAIKVLKPERVDADLQREFAQEVFIMRKVRHRNVVQFIGACTKLPSLCIVTEFMSEGSIYDFLHKHKGVFKLSTLLKVAIDVSKGINYLHENNIIHRDLKAANILMDENEVAKVADFGVARVKAQSGVMTAETGTYRWMAPEVLSSFLWVKRFLSFFCIDLLHNLHKKWTQSFS
ncbi:hypothetical protein SAY86_013390 [Trapa natans]|uniref:non-specific serine/threonine protein kinase n=1 Tax=Trapa natans TaxID=22666 RepID=A0AAN7MFU2_TRANT|nr:hypothetical protein SAY86_013390 [Trapa natans]